VGPARAAIAPGAIMRCAFTLVELLVVVAIIVVLLALLTPALDKAIYEAEMTECAANMKAVCTAVNLYAVDYKRWYPKRDYTDNRSFNLAGTFIGGAPLDTRPRLMPYVSLNKMLQDPFILRPADISPEASPPSSHTYSSYWLWFGWQLVTRSPGMKKLGDRMTWTEPTGTTYLFDTMMSDGQAIYMTAPMWIQASHQDRNQRLQNTPVQNGIHTWGIATYSLWTLGDVQPSITMDCNYLKVDGSAMRLDNLTFETATQTHDERLVTVPERVDGGEPNGSDGNIKNYLPR
jgi:prepilin-type N-terminal cleavage/methylation domain-containing protein